MGFGNFRVSRKCSERWVYLETDVSPGRMCLPPGNGQCPTTL